MVWESKNKWTLTKIQRHKSSKAGIKVHRIQKVAKKKLYYSHKSSQISF